MRVLVQGAGIGGCAVAAGLAQTGYDVTVVEKRQTLSTGNAGIILYSNALKCLDAVGLLEKVLSSGFVMSGSTEVWSSDSKLIGHTVYQTVDKKYPPYMGINRQLLLSILYESAVACGAKFKFGVSSCANTVTGVCDDVIQLTDGTSGTYDLIIAADGTNSELRTRLFENQQSVFTGYGLWHSMHKRRPQINEKVLVIGNGCRIGFIPLTDETMYVWAAMPETEKVRIDKKDMPLVMREKFSKFTGLAGDIINEIDNGTYVHFTAVEEVHLPKPWFKGNVVFIGDSAHASLPFMAQGGAQALHDAVALMQILNTDSRLSDQLQAYTDFRFDIANTVQNMSRKIGEGYRNTSTIDISKSQTNIDTFYFNTENFTLPCNL